MKKIPLVQACGMDAARLFCDTSQSLIYLPPFSHGEDTEDAATAIDVADGTDSFICILVISDGQHVQNGMRGLRDAAHHTIVTDAESPKPRVFSR